MALRKILVGTDFSAAAEAAARVAVELAHPDGATLTLCHVVELPAVAYLQSGALALEAQALADALVAERAPGLRAAAARLAGRTGLTVDALVVVGRAAPALVAAARDGAFDLVVVGTKGRGALHRVLLGSVTSEVMRTATCPVLTVPVPAEAEATAS